jgi:TonB-dependent receptor
MKRFLLFFLTLGSLHLIAQSGSVTGYVIDDLGTLPGATITIQDTSYYEVTNNDGYFVFSDVPVGQHTLLVSYIGYSSKEVNVEVEAGVVKELGSIKLDEITNKLDEVVVKGSYYPSQVRALNVKKKSINVIEVLSADGIGKLPDRNAAEAVQRVSGVSIERDHGEGRYVIVRGTPLAWNSTLLNGNRMPSTEGTSNDAGGRTSPLDIFPAEMIKYVKLSKAITPDMEGDAIGGSVDFITLTAPQSKTFNVSTGGGLNTQAAKGIYSASLLYGDRSKDGKFGFLIAGSYWNRNLGTDNYEVAYNSDNFAIEDLELRDYLSRRRTAGVNMGMEFEANPSNKFYLRGMFTDFRDTETAIEHIFAFSDEEFTLRRRRGIIGIQLLGGELGGNHLFGNGKLSFDWKIANYNTKMDTRHVPDTKVSDDPFYQMSMFTTGMTYGGLHTDGNKYLDIDSPSGYSGDPFDNIQPRPLESMTASDLGLDMLYGFQLGSLERDFSGQGDFKYDINEKFDIKVGYKYKNKYLERGNPAEIHVWLGGYYGEPRSLDNYETMEFPANGGFLTEIGEPYNDLLLNAVTQEQLDKFYSDEFLDSELFYNIYNNEENPSTAAQFFDGNEMTNAAYFMGEYDFNKQFSLLGGVRYEHTGLVYNGNSVITNDEGDQIVKVKNDSGFDAFLPMIHFKYSPIDDLNLRLAYTRTFAKANFTDLNPTETVNLIFNSINRGNINLKPTFSNNFDFMTEYYFKNVGLLSGGVFYKNLSNVIYTARTYEVIDGNRFDIYEPQNSENGYLFGFELGLSKRFDKLPGILGGFGLEANYTYTDSEMDVPSYSLNNQGEIIKEITQESLPNQSKNIFNASLFYERNNLTMRLAGNYKGESLAVVQANPENYRWYDKNFTLDFSGSYKISEKLKVFAELNNLTNEPLRYYQGQTERPEQVEYYALRGQLGLQFSLY